MKRSETRYTVETSSTKHTVASGEYGLHVDGEEQSHLVDRERLRSFTGTLADGTTVPIYVQEGDSEHEYTVYLRGEAIPVRVVTHRDERLIALRKNTSAGSAGGQLVVAPMPGLLKQMLVAEGETVEKGKSLCILEAMKMENEIKAPARLVVKRLIAAEGSAVEKGTHLLELTAIEG